VLQASINKLKILYFCRIIDKLSRYFDRPDVAGVIKLATRSSSSSLYSSSFSVWFLLVLATLLTAALYRCDWNSNKIKFMSKKPRERWLRNLHTTNFMAFSVYILFAILIDYLLFCEFWLSCWNRRYSRPFERQLKII
jgi:hypothetical protein